MKREEANHFSKYEKKSMKQFDDKIVNNFSFLDED